MYYKKALCSVVYIYIRMCQFIAGPTAGPNWMKLVKETHGYLEG